MNTAHLPFISYTVPPSDNKLKLLYVLGAVFVVLHKLATPLLSYVSWIPAQNVKNQNDENGH